LQKVKSLVIINTGERTMYVIKENIESLIEIKKSKFITKIYKVYSIDEVNDILNRLKDEYRDATHICYAYRIGNTSKFSDDGEPGGTAGLPMMDTLIKKDLNFVLAVVIRYFGGIKLGSGGLVRAYASCVSDTISLSKLNLLGQGYRIKIVTTYDKSKKLDYILKDKKNIKKEYLEEVTYIFEVLKEELDSLDEWKPQIIEEVMIEKDSSLN